MPSDLILDRVSKTYGDFTAVHETDLAVPAGSFFALLGSSGSGKTTTLRMAAGLEKPSTGRILLDDQDVTRLPPYKRPVNTVFQSYALFPNMDVFDNVAFGPRRRGIKDVKASVTEMLELVELTPFAHRKPSQLSGGQQQRVAIARALINQPGVLLLDEPLGALDLKLRRQMQLELKRIQSEVGITFLHVTHDQEEAMTMADTIAVMNLGRIEQMGAPVELYDNPGSVFVANFLGQSNLVPGRVVSRGGGAVEVDVAGVRAGVPAGRCHTGADDVWVGIRPERMWISAPGDAATVPTGGPRAAGAVTAAVFNGVATQYVVHVPAWDRDVNVFQQNTGARPTLSPGAAVEVGWAADQGFVLDGTDGADAGRDVVTQAVAS